MERKNNNRHNMFWGLFFLGCAALILVNFLLEQLGFDFHISLIKIIFTLFFATAIAEGLRKMDFFSILIPGAFIFIMYDDLLGIDGGSFSILCIALFAAIGLSIIFPKSKGKKITAEPKVPPAGMSSDSFIRLKNCFNSTIRYVNSSTFSRGEIEDCFGSMKVYFDNANIKDGEAFLHINVVFASTIIYVPANWVVVDNIQSIAASVNVATPPVQQAGPVLNISGDAAFSSVSIRYI